MSDPGMVLREEDVRRIADYVKPWLRDLVSEVVPVRSADISAQLLERSIRLEEELKAQRELLAEHFRAVNQRFDAVDRRFEAVNQRFDAVDRRFEAVNQRFEAVNQRFQAVDQRFEAVNQRFEDMQNYMDKRFGAMQWTMMVGFTVVTVAVTVFGLFV